MLQGGIEIYEYQPALMHAKTMIVDGIWATVGSTNMDNRSFALNEELNLAVYDRKFARRLEDIYKEDLRYSKKITYAAWAARPWRERFFEFFAFPLQEQL
jgi:cardiolipin synthase